MVSRVNSSEMTNLPRLIAADIWSHWWIWAITCFDVFVRNPLVVSSIDMFQLVGQTWRPLFGLFERSINWDIMIGWICLGARQPGNPYADWLYEQWCMVVWTVVYLEFHRFHLDGRGGGGGNRGGGVGVVFCQRFTTLITAAYLAFLSCLTPSWLLKEKALDPLKVWVLESKLYLSQSPLKNNIKKRGGGHLTTRPLTCERHTTL